MIETPVGGVTDIGEGAVSLTGAVRGAPPRALPNGGAPRATPRTAPPLARPAGPVGAGLRGKEPALAAGAVGVGLGCEGLAADVEAASGGGFAAICTGGILFGAGAVAAAVFLIGGSWMPCASHS
jgi:hypothetical protein